MTDKDFTSLLNDLADVSPVSRVGRVQSAAHALVGVAGLNRQAAIGDMVELRPSGGDIVTGEVIDLGATCLNVLPTQVPRGLSVGDPVALLPQVRLCPGPEWIGRIVDPFGKPLDGHPLARSGPARALMAPPPDAVRRRGLGPRVETGMRAFNTLLPLARGQRIGLFAGSGVGKSTLLGQFARNVDADVVVLALVGERGREVRAFLDDVLGPEGLARSVIVLATSDQSPVEKRRAALAAMSVAEAFRDEGRHVLLLFDSITRLAEAHREIELAAGAPASLGGFPPSTAQMIMALCERAGPGVGGQGDITAVFSVLVAASDMDGPVADMVRGVLDGHVVLDRSIAERGRFPALDLLRSVSRSLPAAANDAENATIGQARQLLGLYESSELMIRSGLYTSGTDAALDRAVRIWPALDRFLGEAEPEDSQASFAALEALLGDPGT